MIFQQTIWILGGDARQAFLARLFAQDGHLVHIYALDHPLAQHPAITPHSDLCDLIHADIVILPLPISTPEQLLHAPTSSRPTPMEEIFAAADPHQLLLGGRVDVTSARLARSHNLTLLEYFDREELTLTNCIPTAEGCLQLAMEHTPITIHGAKVLILGYGRVARACAQRFAALHAQVWVAARKYGQLAMAQSDGHRICSFHSLSAQPQEHDIVVNTVPAPVLDAQRMAHLPPHCLILDLASPPGGVSPDAIPTSGPTLIRAPGLPGRAAPASAAAALKETIEHILCENGLR